MFAETVTYPAAFLAGLLSFFSPCIFPLIPAYFSFITGYSLEQLTGRDHRELRWSVFFSTLAYVAGFSVVFILMGASASYLGSFLYGFKDAIRIFGGIIIIILGIHISGIFRLPFLDVEKKIHIQKKPLHVLGTFLVGMAFGVGWSPCIGPLLGAILVVAGAQETVGRGMILLAVYSAGLAIPFVILSITIHLILSFIRKASRVLRYVNTAAGVLLILMGILLVANRLTLLAVPV